MWVKLCGIRDVETARLAAECGADAIGLNFFGRSPRYVDPATARQIVDVLPPSVEAIGLFVNVPVEQIEAVAKACALTTIQLHGDEPPEFLAALRERLPTARVMRAFRVGDEGCGEIASYLEKCVRLGVTPWRCLVDARVSGSYGGTGAIAPWEIVAREYRTDLWPPLVLAGGLVAENVSAAIAGVKPWGVDVSSGIESSPGVKDPEAMRAFLRAARS
jgi:phosphoribosylanthranilate isomerase